MAYSTKDKLDNELHLCLKLLTTTQWGLNFIANNSIYMYMKKLLPEQTSTE